MAVRVNATEQSTASTMSSSARTAASRCVIIHFNYDAWISANGKTIVERDTWTELINEDGSEVGLTVHIQGGGGIVVRDAGQIVWDAEGNFLDLRGPHEQFSDAVSAPPTA